MMAIRRFFARPSSVALSATGCDWPWPGAYVDYQGNALPCCMVSTADRMSLGNMVEQGVRAMWEGPAYTAFRGALASADPPAICRACALYHGMF